MAFDVTESAGPPVRKSTPGHGGSRPGAGRKPKGEQNDAYTLLAKAKAKRETYRAQLTELEYKQKAGELMPRDEYCRDLAAVLKIVAVTIESLPDVLERDAGIDGEAVERCQAVIDGLREELYIKLRDLETP